MTWLIVRPKCKTAAPAAVWGNLSTLAQRGEGLLCVLHQRVLRLALDEILEGCGGPCPLAYRRTGQRTSERGIGGKGAAPVVLKERLERLGLVGVAARVA